MDNSSCKQSNSSSADQRSSSKRLYEAVYRLIDFDNDNQTKLIQQESEDVVRSFENGDDMMNQSRAITNGQKICSLLQNEMFMFHLDEKLRMQGYYQSYPILKIECNTVGGFVRQLCLLEEEDLIIIFNKFGKLFTVKMKEDRRSGYALFKSYQNGYVASKILDQMYLTKHNIQLCVRWVSHEELSLIANSDFFLEYLEVFNWQKNIDSKPNSQKQPKLTCRYEIQIQNEKQFQVARRIIGSKGYNMKRIIEDAIDMVYRGNVPEDLNLNDLLKLRLRGKGSGYKEGPQQVQSEDNLHLCVSAKDEKIYSIACKSVEKLLISVYEDYSIFTSNQPLEIKKIDMCQTPQSNFDLQKQYQRISPSRISQLLEMRNRARRQLNFMEADRIRNYLRSCGVSLIDEKGRRGKATDVTTWKYLF